ncbi:hypothetical protein Aph01nite_34300 [Acrocarpospora phusangensis]|uniref:Uncharacterized protein n=1 Tax=Acrocarpospora phusangensis TaxID=1070424 RepID=A0A919QEK9_9ACTN|nr:hypothetical protein [Acrocarpospora phusangensis]GIH25120.1 hypothetical protein Aph01nite_34300 [Acrocarpospora phusangensis]
MATRRKAAGCKASAGDWFGLAVIALTLWALGLTASRLDRIAPLVAFGVGLFAGAAGVLAARSAASRLLARASIRISLTRRAKP